MICYLLYYEITVSRLQETEPVNLADLSDLMKTKDIQPSDKVFGFIGTGVIGQGIIKNLINSDHKVNLYSRTRIKVRKKITNINAHFT